ncbi:ABC transporter ATP-binding protein [Lentibacillus cibarius]|uniref:Spermidine/putrescine import ATP-binding protein PotA n=1 Tax=Lentibacillus cibarius TaxID=2583219 RepID=A0A5S3QMS9_9BACI|nr:ABC transporter ATP-binding protein [Lentibacillus cibarius]TMN23264.1 ABC transporter ATP-binding protein [Lentibacillus cibarius]
MTEDMVRLEGISKKFDSTYAIKELNLEIQSGEFLTLLGPSGCGKTSTLRVIGGFEKPSSGSVWINSKKVDEVEPYNRDVNTVFQSYSLFPHMTVADNIAFGLKMKKISKQEIKKRVREALRLVQLENFADRKPKKLSGGQQQRIAIARAVVNNPKVLLLDEPLGALDLKLRKQMQLELKQLQQKLGMTFIYVTHDQEEALTMSDRIVIMNEGQIEQIGLPEEVYEKPATKFVADFIGETNLFEGIIKEIKDVYATVQCSEQNIRIYNNKKLLTNESVFISVRPEKIRVSSNPDSHDNYLKVIMKDKIYIGSVTKIIATLPDGHEVIAHGSQGIYENSSKGDQLYLNWDPSDCAVFKLKDKMDS